MNTYSTYDPDRADRAARARADRERALVVVSTRRVGRRTLYSVRTVETAAQVRALGRLGDVVNAYGQQY